MPTSDPLADLVRRAGENAAADPVFVRRLANTLMAPSGVTGDGSDPSTSAGGEVVALTGLDATLRQVSPGRPRRVAILALAVVIVLIAGVAAVAVQRPDGITVEAVPVQGEAPGDVRAVALPIGDSRHRLIAAAGEWTTAEQTAASTAFVRGDGARITISSAGDARPPTALRPVAPLADAGVLAVGPPAELLALNGVSIVAQGLDVAKAAELLSRVVDVEMLVPAPQGSPDTPAAALVGQPYREATATLARAGFTVSWRLVHADVPDGTVTAADVQGSRAVLDVAGPKGDGPSTAGPPGGGPSTAGSTSGRGFALAADATGAVGYVDLTAQKPDRLPGNAGLVIPTLGVPVVFLHGELVGFVSSGGFRSLRQLFGLEGTAPVAPGPEVDTVSPVSGTTRVELRGVVFDIPARWTIVNDRCPTEGQLALFSTPAERPSRCAGTPVGDWAIVEPLPLDLDAVATTCAPSQFNEGYRLCSGSADGRFRYELYDGADVLVSGSARIEPVRVVGQLPAPSDDPGEALLALIPRGCGAIEPAAAVPACAASGLVPGGTVQALRSLGERRGPAQAVFSVEVRWPDGAVAAFDVTMRHRFDRDARRGIWSIFDVQRAG